MRKKRDPDKLSAWEIGGLIVWSLRNFDTLVVATEALAELYLASMAFECGVSIEELRPLLTDSAEKLAAALKGDD